MDLQALGWSNWHGEYGNIYFLYVYIYFLDSMQIISGGFFLFAFFFSDRTKFFPQIISLGIKVSQNIQKQSISWGFSVRWHFLPMWNPSGIVEKLQRFPSVSEHQEHDLHKPAVNVGLWGREEVHFSSLPHKVVVSLVLWRVAVRVDELCIEIWMSLPLALYDWSLRD